MVFVYEVPIEIFLISARLCLKPFHGKQLFRLSWIYLMRCPDLASPTSPNDLSTNTILLEKILAELQKNFIIEYLALLSWIKFDSQTFNALEGNLEPVLVISEVAKQGSECSFGAPL
jgi:hypothetical protein